MAKGGVLACSLVSWSFILTMSDAEHALPIDAVARANGVCCYFTLPFERSHPIFPLERPA